MKAMSIIKVMLSREVKYRSIKKLLVSSFGSEMTERVGRQRLYEESE
jgi:hypothetical protein